MICLTIASKPFSFPASSASNISSYLTYFSNFIALAPIPEILNPYSSSPTGILTYCLLKPGLFASAFSFKSSGLSIIITPFFYKFHRNFRI